MSESISYGIISIGILIICKILFYTNLQVFFYCTISVFIFSGFFITISILDDIRNSKVNKK